MNDILMTNIFFIITGVAAIIFTIVLVVLLVYVIKLVKRLNHLTDIVTDQAEKISDDIDDTRGMIKSGVAVGKTLQFITNKILGGKKK